MNDLTDTAVDELADRMGGVPTSKLAWVLDTLPVSEFARVVRRYSELKCEEMSKSSPWLIPNVEDIEDRAWKLLGKGKVRPDVSGLCQK